MKRLVLLPILFLFCALTARAQLATVTVTSSPGQRIPSDFGGISTDFFDGQFTIPNPLFPQLINNLTFPGQQFNFNIEGDEASWPGTPSLSQINTYNNLFTATSGNIRFTLPADMCASGTPTSVATPAVASYIANAGEGWIGVVLGNEPDGSIGSCSGGSYAGGYSGFKTNWDAFRTAINGLSHAAALKFVGPSFGGQQNWVYTSGSLNSFVTSETSHLAYASQHWYTQNGCTGSPTVAAELSAAAAKPTDAGYPSYLANAHAAGTTLRISEMNDVDCGGRSGISNTFAAALWLPDAMFNLASVGTDGVNIFSDLGNYDLIDFPSLSACTINVTSGCKVSPNYYGLLLFQEATQSHASMLPVATTTSANVSVWATVDSSNTIRVVVLNKDQTNSGNVNVTVPGRFIGTLKKLTAPTVTSTTGITYGGQTFDGSTTGAITGSLSQTTVVPSSGVYSFSLAVTQAAILTIPPPVTLAPGWHAIPNTAICGGGAANNPNGVVNASYGVPDNFPNNLNSSYTSYNFLFQGACSAKMDDSNSAIFDPVRSRMIIWGGGHNVYWGNDVNDLEVGSIGTSTPAMNRLTNPAPPQHGTSAVDACPNTGPANTTVTESNGAICVFNSAGTLNEMQALPPCNASGLFVSTCTPSHVTPGSVHTYENLAYIPAPYGLNGHDEMFAYGGPDSDNGATQKLIWALDLTTVTGPSGPEPNCAIVQSTGLGGCDPNWQQLTPTGPGYPISSYINYTAWDPDNEVVWIIEAINANRILTYDPVANTTTVRGSSSVGYHSYGVLDPIHKYFVTVGGGDGVHYINIASLTTGLTTQTPTLTGCAAMLGGNPANLNDSGQYMGVVWDPIGGEIVVYPNYGNVLYILNTSTWKCTSETYGATQGTDYPQDVMGSYGGITSGTEGTFGHFQYSPKSDVFLLCNDKGSDCWYLHRRRGVRLR